MSEDRCQDCGGRLDRPGLFRCKDKRHPEPDLAERIVRDLERDLRDRRGLRHEFEACEADIQDEIRDAWVQIVQDHLDAVMV